MGEMEEGIKRYSYKINTGEVMYHTATVVNAFTAYLQVAKRGNLKNLKSPHHKKKYLSMMVIGVN